MTDSSPVEVARSAASFLWSMVLFGAEQAALALAGDDRRRQASRNLYAMAMNAQAHLGSVLWGAFQVGDSVQRTTTDIAFDLVDDRAAASSRAGALLLELAGRGAEGARTWTTDAERRVAITQLGNNLEVYQLVRGVRDVLGLPPRGPFPLDAFVEKAYDEVGFGTLWAIEGLGLEFADRLLADDLSPGVPLLESDWAGTIPDSSLTMLHAGFGLAFARRILRRLTPFDPDARLREGVEQFLALCASSSRPGCEGAALESLGLVARTWHPQLVQPVDCQLAAVNEIARQFFWHGAGRALYFHPLYIVPGVLSPWPAAASEPPDGVARSNMKAGLAWATALVNMRHPEVLQQLIDVRGDELAADDAFGSGVASALLMALDVAGGDLDAMAICGPCPDGSASGAAAWEALIGEPCRYATSGLRGVLAGQSLLGELFRHHPFPDWFASALVQFKEPYVP